MHQVAIRINRRIEELQYTKGTLNFGDEITIEQAESTVRPSVPVVIPRRPQKRVMTRGLWHSCQDEIASDGFVISESYSTITLSDGRSAVTKRDLTFTTMETHVEIEKFAREFGTRFDAFARRLLELCAEVVGFQIIDERF